MQSKVVLFTLVFGAIIFGVSGLIPSAHAAQLQLNEENCTDLEGLWSTSPLTCSIPDGVEAEIGLEEDEETANILIISGFTTLNIEEGAVLTVSGGIENLGTINLSGEMSVEEDAGILNQGTFNILETGQFDNYFEFSGSGDVNNSGILNNNDDGEFTISGLINNFNTINVNDGTLSTDNIFSNDIDGIINNYGRIDVTTLVNDGELNNKIPSAFINIAGSDTEPALLTTTSGSTFSNSGTLDIDPSGQFIHEGGFSSSLTSIVKLGGLIINDALFTNNGFLEIKFSGELRNLSTFVNEGTMTLTSDEAQIATFDGTDGIILTNNNKIKNECGLILGNWEGTVPEDLCGFELTIISPNVGSIESDFSPTTFTGVGQDRNATGFPVGASNEIEWLSNHEGIIGTGSPLIYQLTHLGTHQITASVLDENNNLITSTVSILVSQVDNDGDGEVVQTDCDDQDPNNFHGNPEVFDGQDNDCDDQVDEGFSDEDMDGFDSSVDCNDDPLNNGSVMFPGNPEVIDGLDNDCVGGIPDNELDTDGDFQIPSLDYNELTWLGDPSVTSGGDCDDGDVYGATRYLGNTEIVDGIPNDCIDGLPDNETDDDSDGYIEGIFDVTLAEFQEIWPLVEGDQDCADNNAARSPGLPEIDGDGIDNDCDGVVDVGITDFDEDGYHTDGSGLGFDCKDDDSTVFTGATEIVDGLDNDCDGLLIDEEIDHDGDGYISGIFDPLGGWDGSLQVLGEADCNDIPIEGLNIWPGAPEQLNGIDDDCDGIIPLNELDGDADGSFADLDCDDNDPKRSPNFEEIVDGIDNDCDDVLPSNEIDDDGDNFIDGTFDINGWFGIPEDAGDNDCDDTNITMFPGNLEILDGFDNDCDTILLDEEIDNDGDGQAEYLGDCDDDDKFNYLGNDERDDGKDNDCDGEIDEGFDLDGDGFTAGNGDCLDVMETDPLNPFFGANPVTVYMGALELPDTYDNDCNGFIDDLNDKFTTPELQENLDDKIIRDYEKQAEKLEKEIKKLEYENRKLDKYADKYEARAEQALEGDTRKAAYYQAKSDRYEDKANDALEDGKESKAAKYQKTSDYFQAKADRALEGNPEKATKYQAKADELRAEISSNESLIEMYGKEILVINMSIGTISVDWSQTIVFTYDNLTDETFDDILDDIKDNLKEIEKLEEKAAKEQEKIDKEIAKGNLEKAAEHEQHKLQALEEIEILEDLNTVLKCAIDFTEEMLLEEVEFSIKINRDSDDAEEGNDSDNPLDMKLKSSDLDLVEESEYVGLRFNDIPLVQGQIIKSAYIQFTSEDKDSGNSVVTIYGQDIDDAPTFTNSDGGISSRTLTSASVTWNIPDWDDNKSKSDQRTSDITSILEEIVNRPNWSEDNSMVFIITDGQGSDRDAYTYDEKSSKAAVLHITTLSDDKDDDD
ncbi:hypothetical protein C5F47_00365 [Nitrosopumilus cobalaminigenes]|uniref:Uncharacterized protein n=1 Tax=Nitrosopumilus cobalaminigenes TaxID=1470066 RepID=A0A7D5M1B7_9ARCH|nr:putative metal-binding motif-containing protein [Nitrosopumilus cobalaminigenes]QLH02148.1 hypothetical protein C5F47_00365 [Nitrosopumilus cobalaminigenes]